MHYRFLVFQKVKKPKDNNYEVLCHFGMHIVFLIGNYQS